MNPIRADCTGEDCRGCAAVTASTATASKTLIVLAMLAAIADEVGRTEPITIAQVGRHAEMSYARARSRLRELEDLGEIVRLWRPGRANRYVVSLPVGLRARPDPLRSELFT